MAAAVAGAPVTATREGGSVPAAALSRCAAVDVQAFAADHWSRAPLLSRAKELPQPFDDLLSPADVDELVADRALRSPFFRTVRDGAGLPSPTRTVTAGSRRIGDLVDAEALAAQYADGATLVLQSLHRMHPPVARFCRELAAELGHPTQCNAYLTPGGRHQGFDFHHDTHDVFVLQVGGRKRWIVHEPVVRLPLPTQARSGADLVPEGAEPLLDVELEPGDALYLPRGYVHAAVSTDVDSVHLTVGVLSTTWYDVLTDVVTLAEDQEAFREALPLQPASSLGAQLPDLLRRAAAWLESLPVEQVEQVVSRRLVRSAPPEPLTLLATAAAIRSLSPASVVRPRQGLDVCVQIDGGAVVVAVPGRTLTLPGFTEPAVRRLLVGSCTPDDLPGLDEEGALVLVRRMLREGIVLPT
jgi:lysine-specific demethylase/histidyl-hydroxylase NO66